MRLIIKDLVPNTKTPNSFEVVVETMAGDADGYENVTVGPFIKDQDEPAMESLFSVIEVMSKAFPHGMGGSDNFHHIEHFDTWFGYFDAYDPEEEYDYQVKTNVTYEEYVELQKTLHAFTENSAWPNDAMTDYDSPNGYVDFKVFYYDENKNQHVVEVQE